MLIGNFFTSNLNNGKNYSSDQCSAPQKGERALAAYDRKQIGSIR
jgi:hypothetical protein